MQHIKVYLGRHERVRGGMEYTVKISYAHPNRNKDNFDFDLGILTVSQQIKFTIAVQPVALPAPGELVINANDKVCKGHSIVSGLGYFNHHTVWKIHLS